ncbi:MAG: type IV secretion system protein [Spirochaetales bacterium]|nr:type IV secretion system protein [Spirochaetales bacterium]
MIAAEIYGSLNFSLARFFLEMHNDLMSSFSLLLRAGLVLYFVYKGYKYMLDESEGKDILEVAKTCLLVTFMYYSVFESGIYYNTIVRPSFDFLTELLSYILSVISKAKTLLPPVDGEVQYFADITNMTQLFEGLDMMFLDFITTCGGLVPSAWTMLTPGWILTILGILALILAYGAMYCIFVFMFIMSYFMMWLLFMVGGIVCILGCFKGTRGIFFGWVKMLCNFSLISIFTAMVVAICYSGISRAVFAMSHYESTTVKFTGDFLGLFVWCFICAAITLKAPELASGLTNAMSAGTGGVANALSSGGSATASGASAGGKAAGRGARNAGRAIQAGSGNLGGTGMNATQLLKSRLGIKF